MDTCGICGTFHASEAYIVADKIRYICSACLEIAKHSYLSICPKCGYTSWINTDFILTTIAFAHLLCPDCCKEFHTIDGFKRGKK